MKQETFSFCEFEFNLYLHERYRKDFSRIFIVPDSV
jgi:hypothetical protein